MTLPRPGASLVTQRLSTHVAILVWDGPGTVRRLALDIGGSPARPPIARVTLPVEGGGVRTLIAFRPDPQAPGGAIRLLGRDGSVLAAIEAERAQAGDGEFDPFQLLDRLEGTGKVRLARFLLEPARTVFKLDADPFYVVNMRHLVDALCPAPGPLFARATAGDGLILCEAGLSDGLGSLQAAVAIGRRVSRTPFAPLADDDNRRRGIVPAWLMLRRDPAGADRTIVIFGKGGFAVRRPVASRAAVPPIIEWRPEPASAAAHRYILDCIGRLAEDDAPAAALAREIAALAPVDGASPSGASALSLAIGTCVATSAGLFLAGRLHDRHGLVQGIAVRGAGFDAVLPLHCLACVGGDARRPDGLGFIALAESPGRAPRPNRFQFALRLHSGAVIESGAVPAVETGAAARASILTAVPDNAATPAAIDRIVGPALDGIASNSAADATADIVTFGDVPASPGASVIVPFGCERAPLLARAGALCANRAGMAVEPIYLLDRPDARAGAERWLAGLWTVFGLPARLVCIPPCEEPAAAIAMAASAARGEMLVLLGEWAVPDASRGLQPLLDALAGSPDIGVCGARILSPDGSIRSAGLDLASADGALALDFPGCGLAGGFPAAAVARDVFAVSGGALAIRRALFERVGGIAAGYATGDWRDADLAARVHEDGFGVRYVPAATVTDFADAVGPLPGVARRIDAWRFARRWSAGLDDWTGAAPVDAAAPVTESARRERAADDKARWAA
jgi:hypothetical protein